MASLAWGTLIRLLLELLIWILSFLSIPESKTLSGLESVFFFPHH
jgi:hypothetical protein